MKKLITITIAIITMSFTLQAIAATTFQCKRGVWIDKGDSTGKVRSRCGKPKFKDDYSGNKSKTKKEAWTYRNYGWPGTTTLHFKNSKMIKIKD